MQIVVVTSQASREELSGNGIEAGANIVWTEDVQELHSSKADVVIDLSFEMAHLELLQSLSDAIVIINSVTDTLTETDLRFIRINGWPGFLRSDTIEAACLQEELKEKAAGAFSLFHKKIEWLPDIPGFVTPRVVGMIINEAFIALKEGVSTKEEINTAMKLGTNYPYGPFEWAEKIGVSKVNELLGKLSKQNSRYASFVR
jgi:3-hydroxybutyryl-CoA dehydrogenase